jgi:hypothetical protein
MNIETIRKLLERLKVKREAYFLDIMELTLLKPRTIVARDPEISLKTYDDAIKKVEEMIEDRAKRFEFLDSITYRTPESA